MPLKISVIGLGNIGLPVFEEIFNHYGNDRCKDCYHGETEIIGVDISKDALDRAADRIAGRGVMPSIFDTCKPRIVRTVENSDYYVIAIYSPEGIEKMLLETIPEVNDGKAAVIIESTLELKLLQDPRYGGDFIGWWDKNYPDLKLITYPHRLVPYDLDNFGAFGMTRAIGGSPEALEWARKLYHFIPPEDWRETDFNTATLSKAMENAIRFIEIAFAQHLSVMVAHYNKQVEDGQVKGPPIDFDELREVMNTKWNIDLKEPRDGIAGSCLPKDTKFSADFFNNANISIDNIFDIALASNEAYIEFIKNS